MQLKSAATNSSTTSSRFLSEEDLSISISKGQKLIQCALSSQIWTLDELSEEKQYSELYYDWPKWERKRLYKPDLQEAFDFTVLKNGELLVEIDQVPKTTSGVAIVTTDTLHATSGSRYLVDKDPIKTLGGQNSEVGNPNSPSKQKAIILRFSQSTPKGPQAKQRS